ncbi:MAG: hypothetical protein GY754_46110 [bacterium]|nr:hypothetical protein [bacterium]
MITEKDFLEKYWYKTELAGLCTELGIPNSGTKAELQQRILHYLRTGEIKTSPKKRTGSKAGPTKITNITLDSLFLKEGLRFNHRLREFFAQHLNKNKISFTKHMGAAVRNAEKNGSDITVRELLEIYSTPKENFEATDEDKTYQWNRFVKDFTQSPSAKNYTKPLKVASILWKQVRESRAPKEYNDSLTEQYHDLIKGYLTSASTKTINS